MSVSDTNRLRTDLIATVISSMITQLTILERDQRLSSHIESNRRPATSSVQHVSNLFNRLPSEKILNRIKLDKELNGLILILSNALEEQCTSDASHSFRVAVDEQQLDESKNSALSQEVKVNAAALKNLEKRLESSRKSAESKLAQANEKIANIRHELKNVTCLNNLELDLVTRWEQTRFTQAAILCEKKEKLIADEILAYTRRTADEQRIIFEIESFNQRKIEEFRAMIATWQVRYDTELKKILATISDVKSRIEEVNKTYEKHKQIYDARHQFIAEYLAQKAEQQRLFELQLHRIDCAVKIQAWWRGVMVRRGLGPYKKKTKKGKKSKAPQKVATQPTGN